MPGRGRRSREGSHDERVNRYGGDMNARPASLGGSGQQAPSFSQNEQFMGAEDSTKAGPVAKRKKGKFPSPTTKEAEIEQTKIRNRANNAKQVADAEIAKKENPEAYERIKQTIWQQSGLQHKPKQTPEQLRQNKLAGGKVYRDRKRAEKKSESQKAAVPQQPASRQGTPVASRGSTPQLPLPSFQSTSRPGSRGSPSPQVFSPAGYSNEFIDETDPTFQTFYGSKG